MASLVPAAAGTMVLKPGIVSSNPDPNACMMCSRDLQRYSDLYNNTRTLFSCCGSDFCPSCVLVHQGRDCPVCGMSPDDGSCARQLKRYAKRGHPWAQFLIGRCFAEGHHMMQSYYEAVRWYRKASAQGHPLATLSLGMCHMKGRGGCDRDLGTAEDCLERAIAMDPLVKDVCERRMVSVAKEYQEEGNLKEAKQVLGPLTSISARMLLGSILTSENDLEPGMEVFTACAMEGQVLAALNVAAICWKEKELPKAKAWHDFGKINIGAIPSCYENSIYVERNLSIMHSELSKLRSACTTCGIFLDRSTRKLCSGCRTFCYCSTECQKIHWERVHDGHRDDCKAAQGLVKVLKDIPACDSVRQVI